MKISATDNHATEPQTGQPLDFRVIRLERRGGDINQGLDVWIRQDYQPGYASEGSDYEDIMDLQAFAAGSTTFDLMVTPLEDAIPEDPENVVTMLWNPGWGQYLIDGAGEGQSWATVTINPDGEDQGSFASPSSSMSSGDGGSDEEDKELEELLA